MANIANTIRGQHQHVSIAIVGMLQSHRATSITVNCCLVFLSRSTGLFLMTA